MNQDGLPINLPLAKENRLVRTRWDREQRKGMDNDDEYFNEVNSEGEVVARYHKWHHLSIYPPQNTDAGWKKFDLSGTCIGQST